MQRLFNPFIALALTLGSMAIEVGLAYVIVRVMHLPILPVLVSHALIDVGIVVGIFYYFALHATLKAK